MEKQYDVIGVENLIMDFAVRINKLPQTDGFAYIRDYCWQSGGNAASAIVALARLGSDCGMVGTTGSDPFGTFCKEDMHRHGVDTSHIKQIPGATTFCICLAEEETQGRSILGKLGDVGSLTNEEIDENYIASAKAIHLGLPYTPTNDVAIRFAREHGVLVSLDAGGPVKNAKELVPIFSLCLKPFITLCFPTQAMKKTVPPCYAKARKWLSSRWAKPAVLVRTNTGRSVWNRSQTAGMRSLIQRGLAMFSTAVFYTHGCIDMEKLPLTTT